MTNEEAIKILKCRQAWALQTVDEREAVEMAIHALKTKDWNERIITFFRDSLGEAIDWSEDNAE